MAGHPKSLAAFRITGALLLGLAGLELAAAPAAAQSAGYRGTQEQQQACTDDVFRLCNQFVPDEPRIIACLQQNRRNLSPLCRQVFDANSSKSGRQPR